MSFKLKSTRAWHKWAGIFAAILLFELGITGFIIDHKEWQWLYKDAFSKEIFNKDFIEKVNKRAGTIKKIQSKDGNFSIMYGARGVWFGDANQTNWQRSKVDGLYDAPIVSSIVNFDTTLFIATNSGIYKSTDKGISFKKFALDSTNITALTKDASSSNSLIGVIEKSRVFFMDINSSNVKNIELTTPSQDILPQKISWARFLYDLHFARGIANYPISLIINDIAGIFMALLSVTGILFWLLPKYYIKRAENSNPIKSTTKVAIYKWMYRFHSPIAGIFTFLPLIYFAISGIVLDHSKELRPIVASSFIDRAFLPPVYNMSTFESEIYGAVTYKDINNSLAIGTRYGLLESNNSGKDWTLNKDVKTFAFNVKSENNATIVMSMGGSGYVKKDDGNWSEMNGSMRSMHQKASVDFSHIPNASWFDVIDGLHSGLIIAPWWIWADDIASILSIILAFTGIYRLFKRKLI